MVTNETYEAALHNQDNMMVMNKLASRYLKVLDGDEIYQCKLMALWNALKKWRPDGGSKFTVYLWNSLLWELSKCLSQKARDLKKGIPLVVDKSVLPNPTTTEILDGLPPDLQDMMKKRYIYGMTLREIGVEHQCCYETVRNKLQKARKYLKTAMED
jgi:DNA-directed RNA polymerase specialized sigma24 family protein